MNLNLKRGKTADLHIVLGSYFQNNTQTFGKLLDVLRENNINFHYSEKDEDKYSIQFHLNSVQKGGKSKGKELPEKTSKKKETFDINLLLSKYSYAQSKPTGLGKMNLKAQVPEDFKLRLYLIYMNSSNLHDVMNVFNNLKSAQNLEGKYIFLLEGIQDFVSGKEMKTKKQKKDVLLSQQMNSQMFFGRQTDMIEEEGVINSREKLEEFLVTLSIESDLDYKLTSSTDESLEYIKNSIASTIESRCKSNLGYFDVKNHSHTAISVYAGFEDIYSLSWVEMLMTAPGISEDKAVAIAKKYPTMHSLMKALEESDNDKLLLEDVKVVHNFDESKAKRLGPAASTKIVKLLRSDNPDEII